MHMTICPAKIIISKINHQIQDQKVLAKNGLKNINIIQSLNTNIQILHTNFTKELTEEE